MAIVSWRPGFARSPYDSALSWLTKLSFGAGLFLTFGKRHSGGLAFGKVFCLIRRLWNKLVESDLFSVPVISPFG